MVFQITFIAVIAMAGVTMSAPHTCVCPEILEPVCASDGETYPNECLLDCHNRETNDNLQVVKGGSCYDFPIKFNVESSFDDVCICTMEYMPVCGSDSKTYGNKCSLECAAKKDKNLHVAHSGSCEESFQLNKEPNVDHLCMCTMEFMPVCGSDSKTYSNKCMLKCAAKKDKDLHLVHIGSCEESFQLYEESKETRFDCTCTREYNPVCGSNGKTYSNRCVFECAAKKDKSLTIAHMGRCEESFQLYKESNEDNFDCVCSREFNPVCGSNGKSYSNRCVFECAAKKDKSLTIAHMGSCQESFQLYKESEHNCLRVCPHTPLNVCGSDGKTYGSECALNCERKFNQKDLHVTHRGGCQESFQLNKKSNEDNFDCICTKEYNPVCGSNLKTYDNTCVFECAAKKDKSLTMLYPSVCVIM